MGRLRVLSSKGIVASALTPTSLKPESSQGCHLGDRDAPVRKEVGSACRLLTYR